MRRVALLTVLSVVAASCAMAGSGLGLYGSYWSPDDADATYGGGVKLKAALAETLCIEIRGSYFPSIEDEDVSDDELEAIPVEGGLALDIPMDDALTFTVGGGAGYYIMPEVEIEDVDVDPDDELGFYAVAGVELALSEQVALFAEAKYTWLEVEGMEVDGTDVDLDEVELTGLGANAGLMLLW